MSTGKYNITSLDDIFSEIERDENKIVNDPDDALAVSCVYWTRNIFGAGISQISDRERDMAKAIRDYYHKKLMVLTLKGKSLSKFRLDLVEYIKEGYTNRYPEKFKGLIHKLPEFYHYDLAIDELRINSTNEKRNSEIGVKTLTPVQKLERKTKGITTYHYWFHDDNKYLYKFRVHKENELERMFDSLFTKGEMRISAHFQPRDVDDLHFSNIKGPQLVF